MKFASKPKRAGASVALSKLGEYIYQLETCNVRMLSLSSTLRPVGYGLIAACCLGIMVESMRRPLCLHRCCNSKFVFGLVTQRLVWDTTKADWPTCLKSQVISPLEVRGVLSSTFYCHTLQAWMSGVLDVSLAKWQLVWSLNF